MKTVPLACFALVANMVAAQEPSRPADTPSKATQQTSDNKPKQPKRVRISQMAAEKLLIFKVQPEYPIEARKRSIEGVVIMKAVIALGTVKDLKLVSGEFLLV